VGHPGRQVRLRLGHRPRRVLQQPVKNTNLVARATVALGEHQLYAEFAGAKVESAKSFSANQISSSTGTTSPFFNLAYPSTGTSYNTVFNALVGTFPQLEANRGLPIAFRWRCLECGPRQIDTSADTARFLLAADGPLGGGWDYKVGASTASSEATSLLGNGYFFGREFAALINTGVLNPFLAAGQSQTPEALSALAATSANGVTLYGGKFTVQQFDGSVTGPVFKLPAGEVMAAVGADVRTEKFRFNGNATDLATQARVFNAPFDSINSLNTVKRDIKALYGEVLVPVVKGLELTWPGATTTTPASAAPPTRRSRCASRRWRSSWCAARTTPASACPPSTSCSSASPSRPTAARTWSTRPSAPTGKVDTTKPGCESITPTSYTGGKPDLGPEESKQWTAGFVWEPMDNFSLGVDLWSIRKTGTIQSLALADLVANSALFPGNFLRDAPNNLVAIDTPLGQRRRDHHQGHRHQRPRQWPAWPVPLGVVLDGSYLLEKKSRLIASAPFGGSEVGVHRAGDLGLRWKHSLTGTYSRGPWTGTLQHLYRSRLQGRGAARRGQRQRGACRLEPRRQGLPAVQRQRGVHRHQEHDA
jgi:iron complex outermembrane receptor protein